MRKIKIITCLIVFMNLSCNTLKEKNKKELLTGSWQIVDIETQKDDPEYFYCCKMFFENALLEFKEDSSFYISNKKCVILSVKKKYFIKNDTIHILTGSYISEKYKILTLNDSILEISFHSGDIFGEMQWKAKKITSW